MLTMTHPGMWVALKMSDLKMKVLKIIYVTKSGFRCSREHPECPETSMGKCLESCPEHEQRPHRAATTSMTLTQ